MVNGLELYWAFFTLLEAEVLFPLIHPLMTALHDLILHNLNMYLKTGDCNFSVATKNVNHKLCKSFTGLVLLPLRIKYFKY